jgi:uncharacterized protein YeaO (DUF488 family)
MIKIKRVYEKAARDDGYRILVDRLWPRGLSKETAGVDTWLKEIAPSTQLRKWFNHDPKKWEAFSTKYFAELNKNKALIDELRGLERQKKVITLLYGAKDETFNQAIVLRDFLNVIS